MKAPPFKYHDPRSKDEALGLISTLEDPCVLAGGQSLMPMLNFRVLAPQHLIDLNRVTELAGVNCDAQVVRVGAMTRQCDLEDNEAVGRAAPLLHAALRHVGHRQTRNRGTIGGSLCHLDPAAELVAAAAALDATLIAEAKGSSRRIPIAEWSTGYLSNALRAGELLTAAEFPVWPEGHCYGFVEYARRSGDFAIVGVAALLALDANGAITRAAVAIGGCTPAPQRAVSVEQALIGRKPNKALFKDVARLASSIEAQSDAFVKADYRRHLARVLTERALTESAHEDAR
jgi:carbon-monoxide dehydrogenase medium subunit